MDESVCLIDCRLPMGSAVCASMGAKVKPHDLIPQWGERSNRMTLDEWKAFVNAHNERASGSN